MAILQLIAEKEKSLCFDFLEEKIREESRKLIESIYADEVNQFLEKMASISNFNPQHLTTSPFSGIRYRTPHFRLAFFGMSAFFFDGLESFK